MQQNKIICNQGTLAFVKNQLDSVYKRTYLAIQKALLSFYKKAETRKQQLEIKKEIDKVSQIYLRDKIR